MTRAVVATGTVNPVLTIIVGSYVSGVIQDLTCDYNTQVKQGQICAKIDPRPYQTVVDQNKANLEVAKAQLEKDKASLAYAKLTYDRNARLAQTNAVSKDALDNAKNALDQAQAQIGVDEATIEQRQAELDAAQVNLDYTNIVSPVNGTVVSRNVTVGQTVAASFQTPTLFLIATDLTKMQVDTNVSESDIGGIKDGNKALFHRRRVPEAQLRGHRHAGAAVAADRAERRDLRRRGQRRQYRSRAQAGHDGGEPHRHRRAQRRAARAEPGAALRARAGSASAASAGSANAGRPGAGLGAARRQAGAVPVTVGLDDDTYAEIVNGELKAGDQVIVAEQRDTSQGGRRRAAAAALNGRAKAAHGRNRSSSSSTSRGPITSATSTCTRCATSASTIERGEFVAIMGASGSGKSTLMAISAASTGRPAAAISSKASMSQA